MSVFTIIPVVCHFYNSSSVCYIFTIVQPQHRWTVSICSTSDTEPYISKFSVLNMFAWIYIYMYKCTLQCRWHVCWRIKILYFSLFEIWWSKLQYLKVVLTNTLIKEYVKRISGLSFVYLLAFKGETTQNHNFVDQSRRFYIIFTFYGCMLYIFMYKFVFF